MRSGLRYHIVWYMVMNVLEENSTSVSTHHQKMEAVGPGQILCAHKSEYDVT